MAPDEDEIADVHNVLYQQAYERVEIAYLRGQQHEVEDCVVTVMDCRDELSQAIAQANGVLESFNQQVREGEQRGTVPIVVNWDTRQAIRQLFEKDCSALSHLLGEPAPEGTFLTIIVAEGGVTIRETPIPK